LYGFRQLQAEVLHDGRPIMQFAPGVRIFSPVDRNFGRRFFKDEQKIFG